MLEKKQKFKPEFRVYMMETNGFFPWFTSPITDQERRQKLLIEFQGLIDKELAARAAKKAQKIAE